MPPGLRAIDANPGSVLVPGAHHEPTPQVREYTTTAAASGSGGMRTEVANRARQVPELTDCWMRPHSAVLLSANVAHHLEPDPRRLLRNLETACEDRDDNVEPRFGSAHRRHDRPSATEDLRCFMVEHVARHQ